MSNLTFFLFFIPFLAVLLLTINLIFAPHNPYGEKKTSFECGFHSFLGQNRTQFSISFFIFALLFLLFDLEILLIYPYSVSSYINGVYGLVVMLLFFILLTLGFIFELGKKALDIPSRQSTTNSHIKVQSSKSSSSYLSSGGFMNIRQENKKIFSTPTPYKGVTSRFFSTKNKNSDCLVDPKYNLDKSLLVSTKASVDRDTTKFWRQVNSSKVDENNPFFIANHFLKNNPNYNLAVSSLTKWRCRFFYA